MSTQEREARIRALLPMVKQIARRVHRLVPSSELDDLVGEGSIGLIRAVDGFDPQRGTTLEHYARRLVQGAVLNGVRRMDPVTERLRRTVRNAAKARYALAQELGRLPTQREMEARTPKLARARIEVHRRSAVSLDTKLPRGERLELDRSNDPAALVAAKLGDELVRRAVDALPPRQRCVVLAHYFEQKRLRDLVEPLQISPQRVSQLHLIAMRRLRATLKESA